ncbi:uncharacterized protein LOC132700486 [Cylas formicarius]|uniref:uncharacterized protein LOC132700486 n=1 Tax=Cylas formicarius TaxID=197179 RepID=UPI002958931D|nr:uncharacterized protein LOC132700486 [Cylas formicarius]
MCTRAKRRRLEDNSLQLPDELLVLIFARLDHTELYQNVRLVCKRWFLLASTPTLWTRIAADPATPTGTVCRWIRTSRLLNQVRFRGRNDANALVDHAARYSSNLRLIDVKNCWGTASSDVIRGRGLCRLLERCPKLERMTFEGVKIKSCKFFRLIGARPATNRRATETDSGYRFSYDGPMSGKQLTFLVDAVLSNRRPFVLMLDGNNGRKVTMDNERSEVTFECGARI